MIKSEPLGRSNENPFGIQKDSKSYISPLYLSPTRMASYSHQFRLALETDGMSFLNIGSGNKILSILLEQHNRHVVEIDIDFHVYPSITAGLPFLPIKDNSFDVVMCFQVLEHLPFSMFSNCLNEMKRITRRHIIISLPDRSLNNNEKLKHFFYLVFNRPKEWQKYQLRSIHREHFWEIGPGNHDLQSILEAMQNENLHITKHYRNDLNIYHHFFLLTVR